MPTIGDHLENQLRLHLERSDVREQLKPLQAICDKLYRAGLAVAEAFKRIAESAPSSGYEPWLVEHGYDPVLARGMAHLIAHQGNRCARDSARLSLVVHAVRFLAEPRRNKPARNRRVTLLLAAWQETSVIETIFEKAGLDDFEFIRSLESAANGNEDAYRHVTKIAAELAPHLSMSRGPKISAASVAHESFLEEAVNRIRPRRYTYNIVEEDFTDPVTAATRREFNDNDFDPQSAVRRLKTRSRAS